MTDGKKRRRPEYRPPERGNDAAPAPAQQQRPTGLLGGLLRGGTVSPGQSPYPTVRQSFGRGFLAVGSSPVLMGIALILPFLLWVLLLSLGMVPALGTLSGYLALPSLAVLTSDQTAAIDTFGSQAGTYALPVFIAVRAVLTGLIAGMLVEQLRFGRVTRRGLVAGARAIPVCLALCILAFSASLFGNIAGQFLGPTGTLIAVIASVFFLAYGPVVAVEHPRGIGMALRRTFKAARVPGSQNLLLAFVYGFFGLFGQLLLVGLAGLTDIDANPGIRVWAGVLASGVVHLGFLGVYCYRYLYAAPGLPEPAPAASRRRS